MSAQEAVNSLDPEVTPDCCRASGLKGHFSCCGSSHSVFGTVCSITKTTSLAEFSVDKNPDSHNLVMPCHPSVSTQALAFFCRIVGKVSMRSTSQESRLAETALPQTNVPLSHQIAAICPHIPGGCSNTAALWPPPQHRKTVKPPLQPQAPF